MSALSMGGGRGNSVKYRERKEVKGSGTDREKETTAGHGKHACVNIRTSESLIDTIIVLSIT